jgi:hypothetical protein
MSPADVREQKMRDNMAKAAEKAREASLGTADNTGYEIPKDFGIKSSEQGWKKGGKVMEHKHIVEDVKKHAAGNAHHSAHYGKHAAGYKLHHEHVKSMCGGGKTGK